MDKNVCPGRAKKFERISRISAGYVQQVAYAPGTAVFFLQIQREFLHGIKACKVLVFVVQQNNSHIGACILCGQSDKLRDLCQSETGQQIRHRHIILFDSVNDQILIKPAHNMIRPTGIFSECEVTQCKEQIIIHPRDIPPVRRCYLHTASTPES